MRRKPSTRPLIHDTSEYNDIVNEPRSVVFDLLDTLGSPSYSLSYSTRYSLHKRAHDESVAEHSYYVSLFVLALNQVYDFDLTSALTMAILHDLPEIHVSDVNHKVKRACPAIAKAVSKAESAFMARSVPERLAAQYSHLSSGTLEAAAVHVADTMSVVQYLRNEVAFGNSYMVPILKDAELRLAEVCTDFGTLIRASENE